MNPQSVALCIMCTHATETHDSKPPTADRSVLCCPCSSGITRHSLGMSSLRNDPRVQEVHIRCLREHEVIAAGPLERVRDFKTEKADAKQRTNWIIDDNTVPVLLFRSLNRGVPTETT